MRTRSDIFVEKTFDKAEDFLDALSPRAKPFFDSVDPWVFRGHGDAMYKLLPSARRPPELVRLRLPDTKDLNVIAQLMYEADLISRFYQLCDQQGLHIPEDCHAIRATLGNYRLHWNPRIPVPPLDQGFLTWPAPELLPIVAAAQNFGIPTCLLDWTRRSYVAAFFAADDAVRLDRRGRPPKNLSVWSLHLAGFVVGTFDTLKPVPPESMEKKISDSSITVSSCSIEKGPFSIVTAPGASNERLRAQSGLFLVHRPHPSELLPFKPWEEILIEAANEPFFPMIGHYRLAQAEARKLLKYLAAEGITWSSLYPGMAGVAQEILGTLGLDQP